MNKIISSKKAFFTAAVVIFSLMFLINLLTPFIADDYANLQHTYFNQPDRKINSFYDAILSTIHYYQTWGGRIIAQMILVGISFLPHYVIAFINTAMYMIATGLIYQILKDQNHNLFLYIAIHVLLWVCLPDYGEIMFWMNGAVFYLYMSVPILGMVYLFRRHGIKPVSLSEHPFRFLLTILCAFVAGCAMEQMSAGLLIVMTLYLLYYRLQKIPITKDIIIPFAACLCGFILMMLSPGNFARNAAEKHYSFIIKIAAIAYYLVVYMWLPSVLILIGFISTDTANRKKIILESCIFVFAGILCALMLALTPSVPERAFFIVGIFFVLGAGIAFLNTGEYIVRCYPKYAAVISVGIILFVSVQVADTVLASYENMKYVNARNAYFTDKAAKGELDLEYPIFVQKLPLKAKHNPMASLSDLSTNPTFWVNKQISLYFGLHSITGVYTE